MSYFIARAELHGAPQDSQEYDSLHRTMLSRGFYRTIAADDGSRFHLPPAEYSNFDGVDITEVAARIQQAVVETGRGTGSTIIVHHADDWRGYRLASA